MLQFKSRLFEVEKILDLKMEKFCFGNVILKKKTVSFDYLRIGL